MWRISGNLNDARPALGSYRRNCYSPPMGFHAMGTPDLAPESRGLKTSHQPKFTARSGPGSYSPVFVAWLTRDSIPGQSMALTTSPMVVRYATRARDTIGHRFAYVMASNSPITLRDVLGLEVNPPDKPSSSKDCWIDPIDHICGDKKGFAKGCCEAGAWILLQMPGAGAAACVVAHSACTVCCGKYADPLVDDVKYAACVDYCELKRVACIGGF